MPSLIASLIITGISMLILIPGCIIMFASMFASITSLQVESGQAAGPAIASLGIMFVLFLVSLALIMAVSMFFIFTFPAHRGPKADRHGRHRRERKSRREELRRGAGA